MIYGLVDLGTSWHRARMGLAYAYTYPHSLIVQIDRPGRIKVYQGRFHVATLAEGKIESNKLKSMHLFLHEPANSGCGKLSKRISYPDYEHPREFENFQFLAMWNTYIAIANSVSLSGHGGMLIILKNNDDLPENLKIKYHCQSQILTDAFISFMNARHLSADLWTISEDDHWVPQEALAEAELSVRTSYDQLVESTRFVAGLAGCDGAIVITDDLRLVGFGAEIISALRSDAKVFDIQEEFGKQDKLCNVEQFGMRHRSAVKLASQLTGARILAISQDGPVSAVWCKDGNVHVKKGVNLTNMNLPIG